MKILLLSAYHAPSHRRWTRGVVEHLSEHDVQVFTQPPRHFYWRARGNSLYWAMDDDLCAAAAESDLLLTTSMVDLAGLRGMQPALAALPTAVYYHENQFAYPTRNLRKNANLLVTNLYTALAGDQVYFNSAYNRRSFLDGVDTFLAKMPDQIPPDVASTIEAKSSVLPVPLADDLYPDRAATRSPGPLTILWNHRWEYDKAPQRFFNALFALHDEGHAFRLVVVGQQFREVPPIFDEARERLAGCIDQWGWVESRQEYLRWLDESDVVVSTALHEFQGLAVQEAALRGCLPVLPDRLAYPDFFDDSFLFAGDLDDTIADTDALIAHLRPLMADPTEARRRPRADLESLRWSRLAGRYDDALSSLVQGGAFTS